MNVREGENIPIKDGVIKVREINGNTVRARVVGDVPEKMPAEEGETVSSDKRGNLYFEVGTKTDSILERDPTIDKHLLETKLKELEDIFFHL